MEFISTQHILERIARDPKLSKDMCLTGATRGPGEKISVTEANWRASKRQQRAERAASKPQSKVLKDALKKPKNSVPLQRPTQQQVRSPTSRSTSSPAVKPSTSPPNLKVLQPQSQHARVQKPLATPWMFNPQPKKPVPAVPQRQPLASVSANVEKKPIVAAPLSKEENNRRLDVEDAKWEARRASTEVEQQVANSKNRKTGGRETHMSQLLKGASSGRPQMDEEEDIASLARSYRVCF